MYEMLYRSPPFVADNPRHTALKIVRWRETLISPHDAVVSDKSIDLMRKLLCERENRLTFEGI
jgi:hypothetical protein